MDFMPRSRFEAEIGRPRPGSAALRGGQRPFVDRGAAALAEGGRGVQRGERLDGAALCGA